MKTKSDVVNPGYFFVELDERYKIASEYISLAPSNIKLIEKLKFS